MAETFQNFLMTPAMPSFNGKYRPPVVLCCFWSSHLEKILSKPEIFFKTRVHFPCGESEASALRNEGKTWTKLLASLEFYSIDMLPDATWSFFLVVVFLEVQGKILEVQGKIFLCTLLRPGNFPLQLKEKEKKKPYISRCVQPDPIHI